VSEVIEIRRYPDGSIDVNHYVKIGRRLHGQAIIGAGRGALVTLRLLREAIVMRLRQTTKPEDHSFEVEPAE